MGFTAAQAARLAGCTTSQLQHWSRRGIVAPPASPDGYSFRDLVTLRVVASLVEAGLPLARIRAALTAIAEAGDDLAGLRVVTDGSRVWACREDGEILDALRGGQLALFVAVDRFVAELDADVRAFDAERRAFVEQLAVERFSAPTT
ncbi:MAG TPA: helix-turn-helix domain-containing protein [Acidimicrobiia bacterium]|nr:helix-turn-helix domain-containing protein [Acidimicrobiia bacterium]